MPTPTTISEFLDLVTKSGVAEKRQLDGYLHELAARPEPPSTPKQLAQAMIHDGMITTLQAGLLLRGKYKNFIVSGKYKLLEHLGTGGMGSVYLCEHVLMRRRVALKVLPSDRVSDKVLLERFYREARAVAALDHQNIVRAHDIDRDGELHFMVLEYIDGSSLQSIVERFGPLSIGRAVNCVVQAADGLQHAHEAGLVHRDIKPGNLLLDRFGTIKILDLGLAHFFGDDVGKSAHRREIAHVIGTADYVAPEQAINSAKVDIRGDIYSLGVTFFFLLTGRSPYKDGSLSQKLIWHQISIPTPVAELRPDVPRKLAALLERMMAKDPNQRFQTPAELMDALSPWDEGASIPPDREMPQLCPAAAVGSSMSRLPRVTPPILPAPAKRSSLWSWLLRNPRARATLLFGIMAIAAVGGAAAAVLAAP